MKRNCPITFIAEPIFKHQLCTRGEDGFQYRKDLKPGNARWQDFENGTVLSFICPCGCGAANQVSLNKVPESQWSKSGGWNFSGTREKPTLYPSLQLMSACRWHGFLKDGVFEEC